MDSIEQCFTKLDAHQVASIKKHLEILNKALFDSASVSNACAESLDAEFIKHFPELESMKCDGTPFNPTTVVEFREGKAHQVIEGWDRETGILPERIVHDQFHIDIGHETFKGGDPIFYCKTHKRKFNSFKCTRCKKCHNQVKKDFYCNHHTSNFRFECGCTLDNQNMEIVGYGKSNLSEFYDKNMLYCSSHQLIGKLWCSNCNVARPNLECNCSVGNYFLKGGCGCALSQPHVGIIKMSNISPDISRGKCKPVYHNEVSHDFEVDNYLNLFHKPTGLYLMFNKTSFPKFPFQMKKLQKEVYTSKRIEGFVKSDILSTGLHRSKDRRDEFITAVNEPIPDDIKEVFDFFNRFRKFKSFSHKGEVPVAAELMEGSDDADPRDAMVHSYRIRLEETLKKLESAERIMGEMVEEYDTKSVEIKSKHLQIKQLEEQLEEQKSQHSKEVLSIKKHQEVSYVEQIEGLKTANFRFQQRLLEIEKQKAEMDTMGLSVDTVKRENRDIQVRVEKLQGLNEKLVSQIQKEKTKIRELEDARRTATTQVLEFESENGRKVAQIKALEKELIEKTKECSTLSQNLTQVGQKSTEVLEIALSENIEKLQGELETIRERNKELTRENTSVTRELDRMKTTLSGLFK